MENNNIKPTITNGLNSSKRNNLQNPQFPSIPLDINPDSLARMVREQQFQFLIGNGGTSSIAKKLGCTNTDDGLDPNTFDFEQQRELYGKNYFDMPPMKSYLSLIFEGLQDVTILMLTAAAIVSLIIALVFEKDSGTAWIEGTAILVSITLVLNVQAATEYSKTYSFRKQQKSIEDGKHVNIVRGGKTMTIHPREIVVGDVLRISLGDIVQADGLLIDGFSIKMDESALTGESKKISKAPYINNEIKNAPEGEQEDKEKIEAPFILSGTSVMDGQGRMLVVAVGKYSLQGKILAEINKVGDDLIVKTKAQELEEAGKPKMALVNNQDSAPSLSEQHNTTDTKMDQINTGEPSPKPNCCKSFFTIGQIESGGTLMEKLDHLAIDIGKIGFIVSIIVFVVLLIEFFVEEFAYGGVCSSYDNSASSCSEQASHGCVYNDQTGACSRVWNGSHDAEAILEYFITAVTILVVAVPEGLPLAVTLSLSISMRRMARDNNQVKHLDSCETMGSATTICSDKTGTLTENRMTVMRVSFLPERADFSHNLNENLNVGASVLKLGVPDKVSKETVKLLAESISLNSLSTSSAIETSPGVWKYVGNATECALLKFSKQLGYNPDDLRNDKSYSSEIRDPEAGKIDWGVFSYPFSSSRKRMSWLIKNGSGYRLFTKGAPNVIFDACTTMHDPLSGNKLPFNLPEFEKVVEEYSNNAMRAIALGYRDFDNIPANGWLDPDVEMTNITILAVVGIEDPLRPSIVKAIEQCNKAGVDVRMCTGDSLPTAIAISKQCHILRSFDLDPKGNPKQFFAMTGAEFDERVHVLDKTKPKILRRNYDFYDKKDCDRPAYPFLVDEKGEKVLNQKAFDAIWPKLRVLARCQPEDKLTLVRGIRSSKVFAKSQQCEKLLSDHNIDIFPDFQVVAVTGDGTNDAPALKSADVGFAMGIVGTDIAKQACDIVLLDDNFASIVAAVKWGRNVYDAISKFIQFQLTVNICAITIACIGAFVFQASPLRAVQMLWVNLIMDSLASMALATEPPSEHLLKRKPYGKRRPMISRIMMSNMIGQSIYQLIVLFVILFYPDFLPGNVQKYPSSIKVNADGDTPSVHWTIIFNTFVLMTLGNQFNSRNLPTVKRLKESPWEWNVFVGILKNPYFIIIWSIEFLLQVIIVQFGGQAFTVSPGGLSADQWGVCIAFGVGSFFMQFIIYAFLVFSAPYFQAKDLKQLRKKQANQAVEIIEEHGDDAAFINEILHQRSSNLGRDLGPISMVLPGNSGRNLKGQIKEGESFAGIEAKGDDLVGLDIRQNSLDEIDDEEKRKRALSRWKKVRLHVLYGNAFQRPQVKRRTRSRSTVEEGMEDLLRGMVKDRQYDATKYATHLKEAYATEIAKSIIAGGNGGISGSSDDDHTTIHIDEDNNISGKKSETENLLSTNHDSRNEETKLTSV